MIHRGISQQHKIIPWVRAGPASWQGPSYSFSHSSFRVLCAAPGAGAMCVEWARSLAKGGRDRRGEREALWSASRAPWPWQVPWPCVVTVAPSGPSPGPFSCSFFCFAFRDVAAACFSNECISLGLTLLVSPTQEP